jgi:hypothetical protein
MGSPLHVTYNWQVPVAVSTAVALLCIVLLGRTAAPGWGTVAAVVVLLWGLLVAGIYLRTRAFLQVEGSTLMVRRYQGLHTIQGPQVRRVTEFFTRQGPCHKLTVETETGTRRYVVPTALLRSGHSTLFDWLQRQAPQAELDKGSAKTLEQLRIRGLVE